MAILDDRERLKQRLKSFAGWTSPKHFIGLAAAGFRYMGQLDRVKCDYCNKKIVQWTDEDDPLEVHIRFSPSCVFVKELGYSPEQRLARNPKYSEYSTRLTSVRTVPSEYHVNMPSFESIASAGFFFQGTLDRMMCYSCGLILKDWDGSTNPFGIHKRFRPGCFYVQCTDLRKAGFDPPLDRGQDNDILLSMREFSVTAIVGKDLRDNFNWQIPTDAVPVTHNTDASDGELTNTSSVNTNEQLSNNQLTTNGASNMVSSTDNPSNTENSGQASVTKNTETSVADSKNTSTINPSSSSNNQSNTNDASNMATSTINSVSAEISSQSDREAKRQSVKNTNGIQIPNIPESRNGARSSKSQSREHGFEAVPRSCGSEARDTRRKDGSFVEYTDSMRIKDDVDESQERRGSIHEDYLFGSLNSDDGFDEVDSFRDPDRESPKNDSREDAVDSMRNSGGSTVGAFFFGNSESEKFRSRESFDSKQHFEGSPVDAFAYDNSEKSNEENHRRKNLKIQDRASKPEEIGERENATTVKQTKDHLSHSSDVTYYKNRKKRIKDRVSPPDSDDQSECRGGEAQNVGQLIWGNSTNKNPAKVNLKLKGHFGNIPKVNVSKQSCSESTNVKKSSSNSAIVKKTEEGATAMEPLSQLNQGQGLSDFLNQGLVECSDSTMVRNSQGALSSNTSGLAENWDSPVVQNSQGALSSNSPGLAECSDSPVVRNRKGALSSNSPGLAECSDSPMVRNSQGVLSSDSTVPYSLPPPQSQDSERHHRQQYQSLPPVCDLESLRELPMVQAVMDVGIAMDTIVDAVNQRFSETGEMFPDAESLLSSIFDSM